MLKNYKDYIYSHINKDGKILRNNILIDLY